MEVEKGRFLSLVIGDEASGSRKFSENLKVFD